MVSPPLEIPAICNILRLQMLQRKTNPKHHVSRRAAQVVEALRLRPLAPVVAPVPKVVQTRTKKVMICHNNLTTNQSLTYTFVHVSITSLTVLYFIVHKSYMRAARAAVNLLLLIELIRRKILYIIKLFVEHMIECLLLLFGYFPTCSFYRTL